MKGGLAICCADIGAVNSGNFGWARLAAGKPALLSGDIDALVERGLPHPCWWEEVGAWLRVPVVDPAAARPNVLDRGPRRRREPRLVVVCRSDGAGYWVGRDRMGSFRGAPTDPVEFPSGTGGVPEKQPIGSLRECAPV